MARPVCDAGRLHWIMAAARSCGRSMSHNLLYVGYETTLSDMSDISVGRSMIIMLISIPHCSFSLLPSEMSSSLQPSWLKFLFGEWPLQYGPLDSQYEHPCLRTASGIQSNLVFSGGRSKSKQSVGKIRKEYCGFSGKFIRKSLNPE